MDVALTPELQRFVETELQTGNYRDASHLVQDALRCFMRKRAEPGMRPLPKTREELEKELLASIERLDRGAGISGEEAMKRIQQRIAGK
jgi:putative addiction module CopG family antidote